VSALTDAIYQNTPGNSQGYPEGLSWDTGFHGTSTLTPAPAGFSALTGWAVVYPEAGAPVSPNAASDTVQVANFTTYVHLTDGTWVKVQDQAQTGIQGAHYVADFSGDANIPFSEQTLPDGSVSMDAPPAGYNDHFWPTARGTYTPGTVDGVFIEADMKTNDPSANLVAQLGGDWWLNANADYVSGFANNPGIGGNDFTKLTTQWQTLYYTSLSPQQLQADPPPGLLTASQPATTPSVTQVVASPTSGIENVGKTITLTLDLNEAVTVTGTPTLTLNDGGIATYKSGSGTSALTFSYTVGATDTNTSALAVTAVNLPGGASVKDAAGTAADLSGAVKTLSGVQIDTTTPAVTQVVASPTSGIENVGKTITLTLDLNEAVTVTGTPTLTLNDGDTATYVSGSGTSALTFRTTVASTDTSTSALAITGVNLANGASIKDASGAAANLSGAVKTFSGLQVATSSTSPSTPSTPSSIAPVLTVADSTLSVTGRGGTVDLGVNVTTTDPNDAVTVNITGLPKYETITDKLDGQTFGGKNITLTAAQVDSGLTLQSNYRGGGHPVATLTLTATANDPSTGAITTSAPQTITVTDPRPATTSPQTISVTNPTPATGTTAGFLANQGFALLQQHLDPITSAVATSAPPTITVTDHPPATGTTTASLASQSFALLNQYLAGNSGRVDPGQIVAAVSQGAGWGQESFLTRPQH